MENNKQPLTISDFLKTYMLSFGETYLSGMCLDRKDVEKMMVAFADEQTKPLKEEIERLKINNQNQSKAAKGYIDEIQQAIDKIHDVKGDINTLNETCQALESSLSLAKKKENEEFKEGIEYAKQITMNYLKLESELTSVKEQLADKEKEIKQLSMEYDLQGCYVSELKDELKSKEQLLKELAEAIPNAWSAGYNKRQNELSAATFPGHIDTLLDQETYLNNNEALTNYQQTKP